MVQHLGIFHLTWREEEVEEFPWLNKYVADFNNLLVLICFHFGPLKLFSCFGTKKNCFTKIGKQALCFLNNTN